MRCANLKRRLAKLEASAAAQLGKEPVFSEEDRAVMQAILDRTYADPERYADRIALLERIEAEQALR